MAKFKLGQNVRDKITNFEGVIIGKHSWLTGCDQYSVQPPVKDGEFKSERAFDEGRLEKAGKGISPKKVAAKKNGCDYSVPIK
jgi:hypothetical protein